MTEEVELAVVVAVDGGGAAVDAVVTAGAGAVLGGAVAEDETVAEPLEVGCGVTPTPKRGALAPECLEPDVSLRAAGIGIWYALPAGELGSTWTPGAGDACAR